MSPQDNFRTVQVTVVFQHFFRHYLQQRMFSFEQNVHLSNWLILIRRELWQMS